MKRGTEMKKMPRGGWFGCLSTLVIEAGKGSKAQRMRAYMRSVDVGLGVREEKAEEEDAESAGEPSSERVRE